MQMTCYYIEKALKTFCKKKLELTIEFSEVAEYKINIQKSVAFLYPDNEISESGKKKALLKFQHGHPT